ncbi:MAG: hypothetical protein ABSG38_10795 [Spirochaetia bacterium]|jgi:hypothetical protein
MKKSLILVVAGLLALSTAGFAKDIAIGAEAASRNFNDWGGRFVFHLPKVPLYFGLGVILQQGNTAVDFTMDYWFLHGRLVRPLDYYIGIGGYAAIATSSQFSFALGARLPIGLQIWALGNVLEIFLEIAPAWIPIDSSGIDALNFEAQPALGFRIWF